MRLIAELGVVGILLLVLFRLFGITTDIPELDRWVAALIDSIGLG
jgi:hypothetical protein